MTLRHFLTLLDFSTDELQRLVERATVLKQWHKQGRLYEP